MLADLAHRLTALVDRVLPPPSTPPTDAPMEKQVFEAAPATPARGTTPARGPELRSVYAKDGPPVLSDGVTTLAHLFARSASKFADNACLGWRPKQPDGTVGDYQWMTYAETAAKVDAVGSALAGAGVKPKDRVGVYGANSPEWMIAMQACNRQNLACVPLYDSLGETAVEFILTHSESGAVFAAADKLPPLLAAIKAGSLASSIPTIVTWGDVDAASAKAAAAAGVKLIPFEEFASRGASKPAPPASPSPEDLCTIMYTSGTTGDPKGVKLSHRAVIATVAGMEKFLEYTSVDLGPNDATLSYLPLAHIFDRVAEELMLNVGGRIGYFQGDVRHLVDDIGALRPTLFMGVPRVFDRIYAGATSKIKEAGGIIEFLFNWGFSRKLYALQHGVPHAQAAPLFDRLVFSKIKQRLGGRVRLICSGGAPLARHVEDFLNVTMCAPVVQGYGLTETCAASFIAVPGESTNAGTVGPPLPSVGLRLEAVPEMGCDPSANPPRGEVCIVGATLFSGYYKDAEKTAEVWEAGADGSPHSALFHTGDIGEVTPEGLLKIVDRKKNIFKLSQGEYIAVEKIEAIYKKCALVEQVWVYGNSFENALVGVVVPHSAPLRALASDAGVENADTADLATLAAHPDVKAAVLTALTAVGKAAKLKGFEFVKSVHIDDHHFCVEDDTLTPTFKLKRPQLQKRYQGQIDAMYAAMKG